MAGTESEATLEIINRFNTAFNRHDVNAVMAMMTDDVVFENTAPFPDGTRYEGQGAGRQFWEEFFQGSPQARFETEDQYASGDRCTVRWIYHWVDGKGQSQSWTIKRRRSSISRGRVTRCCPNSRSRSRSPC